MFMRDPGTTKGASSRFISLVFLAVFAASALAGPGGDGAQVDAKAWLAATKRALSHLNYRGMVTYLKDNRIESLQVIHAVIDGQQFERLLSVNTPLREIVRDPEKVICYFPDSRSMSVENRPARHSFLLDLPNDLGELSRNYALDLGGTETIAQRQARLVKIRPLDDLRYGRRLWVDVDTKLPLKFELLDENGQVLELMAFSSLSVEEFIPAKELAPTTVYDASWQVRRHEALPAETLNWTLDNVPDGFRLMAYTRQKRGPENRTIDHILLGDGFAFVSIYIDHLMRGDIMAQPRKVGAINAYTRKFGDYLVTVMGEVPPKTVQVIANGIKQPAGGMP
jgi:sigma-E factor negative regulatory protein RseB